jgi:hypothetical protein
VSVALRCDATFLLPLALLAAHLYLCSPERRFVRTWVPELADVSDAWVLDVRTLLRVCFSCASGLIVRLACRSCLHLLMKLNLPKCPFRRTVARSMNLACIVRPSCPCLKFGSVFCWQSARYSRPLAQLVRLTGASHPAHSSGHCYH